jgi:hypothetical protein
MKELEDKIDTIEKDVLILKSLIQAEVGSAGIKGNLTRHIDSIYTQIESIKTMVTGSKGLEMRLELLQSSHDNLKLDTQGKFLKIYEWVKWILISILTLVGKAVYDFISNANITN